MVAVEEVEVLSIMNKGRLKVIMIEMKIVMNIDKEGVVTMEEEVMDKEVGVEHEVVVIITIKVEVDKDINSREIMIMIMMRAKTTEKKEITTEVIRKDHKIKRKLTNKAHQKMIHGTITTQT